MYPIWLECKQTLEVGWFEVKTKFRRRFDIPLWRELILTESPTGHNCQSALIKFISHCCDRVGR